MEQVIYKIINLVNDKFYVGSTTNRRERFRTHRNRLRNNKHHATHLQAAWNKYGEIKFAFLVVEEIPIGESLRAAEDRWLAEHVGKDYCYNKSRYSDSPMRGVPKEQHPCFGVPKTEEHRQQISQTLKEFYAADPNNHPRVGKTHTEKTKAQISAAKKANPAKPWLGKNRDEATRKKIGDAQRGVTKGPRTFTPEGLARAQENMRRVAAEHPQERKDWAEVLAKFPDEVRTRYDFSKAVYTGALARITGVVCLAHGEFSNYSAQFRKGRGCPSCGAEVRSVKKRAEMLEKWQNPTFRMETINAQNKGRGNTHKAP